MRVCQSSARRHGPKQKGGTVLLPKLCHLIQEHNIEECDPLPPTHFCILHCIVGVTIIVPLMLLHIYIYIYIYIVVSRSKEYKDIYRISLSQDACTALVVWSLAAS